MNFQIEHIYEAWDEAIDLMDANHKETGSFDQTKFNPSRENYEKIEDVGMLKLFTARDGETLVGYAIFLVSPHLHYSSMLFAQQDVMFMDKAHRGIGAYRFMNWIDEVLAEMGVEVVIRSVHVRNDYSRALMKIGYEKIETGFMRRLN